MRLNSPKSKVQSPKSRTVRRGPFVKTSATFDFGHWTLDSSSAFTLMEVLIASGIFFICMFAILGLVSQTLRNARILRTTRVDAGMIAAQLTLTNKLYEGSESGDFGNYY